jgi:hypothetical protein
MIEERWVMLFKSMLLMNTIGRNDARVLKEGHDQDIQGLLVVG